eukprot:m.87367 g.87367  ORF g.87367 m.87367 type:complete len:57 (-) comp14774_c0_seq1:94-264(-)
MVRLLIPSMSTSASAIAPVGVATGARNKDEKKNTQNSNQAVMVIDCSAKLLEQCIS